LEVKFVLEGKQQLRLFAHYTSAALTELIQRAAVEAEMKILVVGHT
jgi:hypothetical protein